MSLLNFLVTSKTRKDLLSLLWKEGLEASGHQLARLANSAYSSVHAELEAMKREGLVHSRTEGRSEVFAKSSAYPFKNVLLELLQAREDFETAAVPTSEDVRANLAKLGTPVATSVKSNCDLSPEEAFVYGLELARNDSTVARSLPVGLAKNKSTLDWKRMEFLARKLDVLPVLGFYMELTATLSTDKMLRKRARELVDRRRKKMELFFKNQKPSWFEQKLVEKNTPTVARNWHFLMNMGMDSFEDLFRKNGLGNSK
jgi:DNA-binding transcriptional ArsR family regulator